MFYSKLIFWACCSVIFYNYAGYALIIMIINSFQRKKQLTSDIQRTFYPTVSFIVAAYNEEDCIEQKIRNSLEQDYPSDKMEILFITDGSTDRTNEIIARYPTVRLLFQPERRGKSAALNRSVAEARNEILIFSDANTMLNHEATSHITKHYIDPKVGGVAGEKKVLQNAKAGDEVGAGEGLYWKYESGLKKLDSAFYSVVGAAGELFSLKRTLFESLDASVILDDFIISMKIAQNGYRVRYEPEAFAMELPSESLQDEKQRKIRIAAGGFQAISMLKPALFSLKYPRLSFLYISHRVLRWTLTPLCLVGAFLSNSIVAYTEHAGPYTLLLAGQILFYGLAFVGAFSTSSFILSRLARIIYYFVFMNISVFLGFFRFIRGRQPSAWAKVKRSKSTT